MPYTVIRSCRPRPARARARARPPYIAPIARAPPLPAGTPEGLESTLPSEAALETSILRCLAGCLEQRRGPAEGAVAPASPAQPEEDTLALDAMAGLPDGRYAALQFRRPRFHVDTAYFELPLPQFCAMLRYPPGSAFYMLPVARTDREMQDVQACLLDGTLAVDAQDLIALFNHAWLAHCAPGRRGGPDTCTLMIYVDLEYGTAYAAAPSRALCCLVPFARAGSLFRGSDRTGFVVGNRAVKSRDGGSWGRRKWKRHAAEAAELHGDPAYILRGRGFAGIDRDMERLPLVAPHLGEWARLVWGPAGHAAGQAAPDYGGSSYAVRLGDAPCR